METLEELETSEKEKRLILHSPMRKVFNQLTWPSILSMVFIGLSGFVDAIYIGRLIGEEALAGVAISIPLTFFTIGFGVMIGRGSGVVLGIALGSNDKKTQRKIWGNMILLTLLVGVLSSVIFTIFARNIVALMGAKGALLEYGTTFFRVYAAGNVINIMVLSVDNLVRSEGKLKLSMYFIGIGVLLNIMLNPFFILVLKLGVAGSALATISSNLIISLIIWIYYLKGNASFDIDLKNYTPDFSMLKRMLGTGFPSLVIQVMQVIQSLIIFNLLTSSGTDVDVAFYGASTRIYSFLIMPVVGMLSALQPVLSINYGAGNYGRVREALFMFTRNCLILIALLCLPALLFPSTTLSLILPQMQFTGQMILDFLMLTSCTILAPIVFNSITFFQSVQNPKISGIIALTYQFLFFIPAIYFGTRLWGTNGIYYGIIIVTVLTAILTVVFIGKELDKLNKKFEFA